MIMPKVKYSLVVAASSVLLSACNIHQVNLAYCPAAVGPIQTNYTLKVGEVYDDRMNYGDQTNDPREIGEFSWQENLSPNIYYGPEPVAKTVQTSLNMSLQKAGYKLTPVHPDRILVSRIDEIKLDLQGKDNLSKNLYCKLDVKFALVDANNKVVWRKELFGEGNVDVRNKETHPRSIRPYVKEVFNRATDDLFLQLEKSEDFNKALR